MAQLPPDPMLRSAPSLPSHPIGAIEALGLGWHLLMADFWSLWLLGLLLMVVLMGAGMLGPGAIVVSPPLLAGLYLAVARRMDGFGVEVGELFTGFKERFGPSIVALLIPMLGGVAVCALSYGLILVLAFGGVAAGAATGEDELVGVGLVAGIALGTAAFMVLYVCALIGFAFFTFVVAAVWDRPDSGWEAVRTSARLVRDHFWSVVGFHVLSWLIGGFAGGLISLVTCGVGWFFAGPALYVWHTAAVLYLYRSWTGRPDAVTAGASPRPTPIVTAPGRPARRNPRPQA